MSKYGFREMEVDDWKFFPYVNSKQYEQLKNAAYVYAYRNGKKFQVMKGEHDGIPGAWLHRLDKDESLWSKDVRPEVGEVQTGPEGKWDLDRVAREGSGFIELSQKANDPKVSGKVQSLRRAISRYEEKHGVVIRHMPTLSQAGTDGQYVFGWDLFVVSE